MINSIKQLIRTPFKVTLFFFLTVTSTTIMVLGFHVWRNTEQKLNEMEGTFTTIATVTQKEDSMETVSTWDAALQMYSHSDYPVYNKIIPDTILQFEGAHYLKGPEKRPYYGAYLPEYNQMIQKMGLSDMYFTVEFSPLEDCIPNKPVRVNIINVLSGKTYGNQLWYCDHYTENPTPLYADKRYIASLSLHENTHVVAKIGTEIEYVPGVASPIFSSQFNKAGEKMKSILNLSELPPCEEVTEDFYETGRGQYWMKQVKTYEQFDATIPVLPTDSLELLPAFHEGDATVINGREFTDDEVLKGDTVCLIAAEFAQTNDLTVGDKITLPLYFANYRTAPSEAFGYGYGAFDFSLLNSQGEFYPAFWKAEYTVVGTYKYSGGKSGGPDGRTEMARDMIIIPSKSVKSSDENNIVDYGPMQDTTTSFQIPNGTISQFQVAFNRSVIESNSFVITYDDNGYEQVSSELKSARNIAILLVSIGTFSTIAILLLLLFFFVIKQKKRTAIERSLGLSCKQCRISVISGIMLLTAIATTAGSIGSSFLLERIPTTEEANQTGYSTMYSSWAMDSTVSDESNETATTTPIWYINLAVPAILFFFMLISSVLLVNRNLAIEPIMLLSTKGD